MYSCLTKFQVHSKVIQLYIYTYIIFQFIFYYRYFKRLTKGLQFPVLYSGTSLVIHFKYTSAYMSITNSQSIPSP